MDWDFSGIDPAQLDDFEKALARAEDTLGTNELQIRRALDKLDLDTSGLTALRETRNWISTKRPELRRRNQTIQAVRESWSPGSAPATGLTPFDEALYNKAVNNPDAYAAALALTQAAQTGKLDQNTLAQLEKRTGDADFATALMYAMGATRFRELLTKTGESTDRATAQRLQTALGKTLAAASPRLTTTWRSELTANGSAGQHYWLSRALMHGTYDADFLVDVARKIEAANRVPVLDPLPGVLTALSRVPEAAQDFFVKDPEVLKRLLNERRMFDDGKALSAALLTATTTFRDHDGSAQNPSRGYLSAKLASELIHLEAKRLKDGEALSVTPNTMSRILATYIVDVNRVANSDSDWRVGVAGEDHPGLPGREPWGARLYRQDLKTLMAEVFKEDPKGFALVAGTQTIWASKLLDASAARMAAGKGSEHFYDAAHGIAAGFGFITDAAGLARIEQGQELDEAQERNAKVLAALVNTGLAIPQHAGWPIAAGVVSAWTGIFEEAFKGVEAKKATTDANTRANETHFLVEQLAAQAMLKRGLFGQAEPPDKHHPWASLSDLPPGSDPRKAPNNFLKEDGKTLMTREEMLATKDADGNPVAYDAYRKWIYDGPAGKEWSTVRSQIDSAFLKGFNRYQQ
ncbi:DUF6571 family protein [Thermopolyspora sp. NPDC052614]|uniref:DUF6571 family protein n=1 Tax=Thermopolyspora sp. NPDC052614 TaxID=3155682 RepID=UPI003426EA04